MAHQISPKQDRIVKETITTVFQAENIAKTAIDLGYDINAGFLPQEFQAFSRKVTDYVLGQIRINQESKGCYLVDRVQDIKQLAVPLINAQLQSICNVVPESQIFYPHPRAGLWTWLASIIWPPETATN